MCCFCEQHVLSDQAPALVNLKAPGCLKASPRGDDEVITGKRSFANEDGSPTGMGLRASCYMDGFAAKVGDLGQQAEAWDKADGEAKNRRVSLISTDAIKIRSSQGASSSQRLPKPDFSGVWKMTRCEGDLDAFMKEMGVAWGLRKAAAAVGYGVNATYHTIQATEKFLHVETKNPKGTFLRDLVLDGSEQDDVDPVQKKPIKVIPYWEVKDRVVLTIEAFMPMPGGESVHMPVTRRFMQDEDMIVEQTTPGGIVVKRVFTRQ